MAQTSIPVDLFNPGQVFACLGFLEAAEVLLGNAEGGFDWTNDAEPCFEVHAEGDENPFCAVLEFLSEAQLQRLAPKGYTDPLPTKKQKIKKVDERAANDEMNDPTGNGSVCTVETFPAPEADRLALPLRFERKGRRLDVTHWCDASSRNSFKLFAGQQRSAAIARQMRSAVCELWDKRRQELIRDPLGLTVPLGGSSFKFDARKAWTAIDAGYSPDEQTHAVEASPVVEMLAAVGLEHARPDEFDTREVRYGVWKGLLPSALARPALGGVRVGVPMRIFRFTLDLAGKNKIVTFAQEETNL
jgi:CRISPR-associated protein Csx14